MADKLRFCNEKIGIVFLQKTDFLLGPKAQKVESVIPL